MNPHNTLWLLKPGINYTQRLRDKLFLKCNHQRTSGNAQNEFGSSENVRQRDFLHLPPFWLVQGMEKNHHGGIWKYLIFYRFKKALLVHRYILEMFQSIEIRERPEITTLWKQTLLRWLAKDAVEKTLELELCFGVVNRRTSVYLFRKALPNGRIWCWADERIRVNNKEGLDCNRYKENLIVYDRVRCCERVRQESISEYRKHLKELFTLITFVSFSHFGKNYQPYHFTSVSISSYFNLFLSYLQLNLWFVTVW